MIKCNNQIIITIIVHQPRTFRRDRFIGLISMGDKRKALLCISDDVRFKAGRKERDEALKDLVEHPKK